MESTVGSRSSVVYLLLGLILVTSAIEFDPDTCDGYLDTPYGFRCYRVMNGTKTQREAEAYCLAIYGGHLISISSAEVAAMVDNVIKPRHPGLQTFWTGAIEKLHQWKWLDDGKELYDQGCYAVGEGDTDFPYRVYLKNNSHEECVHQCRQRDYRYARVQGGEWCSCSRQFREVNGMSLDCNNLCRGDQGITCGGRKEFELFVVDGAFSYWGSDLPNDHLEYQACALMDHNEDFQHNDAECSEKQGILCDLGPIDGLKIECKECFDDGNETTVPPVVDADEVTTKVKCFGLETDEKSTKCFYLSNDEVSWFKANEKCIDVGGKLATFKSLAAQLEVVNYTKAHPIFVETNFWIGMTRSSWEWESGDRFVYSQWKRHGRPSSEKQRCVAQEVEGWEDVECDSLKRYICEYDQSSIPYSEMPTTEEPTTEPVTEEVTTPVETTTTPTTVTTTTTIATTTPSKEKTVENAIMAGLVAAAVGIGLFVVIIVTCILYSRKQRRLRDLNRESVPAKDHYFFGLEKKPPPKERPDLNTVLPTESAPQPDVVMAAVNSDAPATTEPPEPPCEMTRMDDYVNSAFEGLNTIIDDTPVDIPNGDTYSNNNNTTSDNHIYDNDVRVSIHSNSEHP